MPKFSCWELYDGPFTGEWDAPDDVVEAKNHEQAASTFGDRRHEDAIAVLVRNDATGELVEIETSKEWTLDMYKPVTAEEMKRNG